MLCLTGFLHVLAYELSEEDESHLLGYTDVSKYESDWSSLILCPPRLNSKIKDRKLTFSGSPRLNFTVEIQSSPSEIEINESAYFKVDQSYPVSVFQFIPHQDISKTQLDVTVTSDSDVPAYLKVSQDCKDVNENIRLVDYKGESIRLSFAKKGRITLSKVSLPPLTDSTSSWFIGIALKNDTGATEPDARKTGTLTLTKSFDYSYTGPMLFIILIPLCGGVLVAFCALISFKEPHVNPRAHSSSTNKPSTNKPSTNKQDIQQPLLQKDPPSEITVDWSDLGEAMKQILISHWFGKGPKTYSYITSIVGWVLIVGAFQFVLADWYLMIQEGDRDNCYYNDFCYRVLIRDIPFNLMISNLAYVIHALILAFSVFYMEAELFARCRKIAEKEWSSAPQNKNDGERLPIHAVTCPNIAPHLATMSVPQTKLSEEIYAEAQKKKFSFSIGYAFAWALFFEGLFSSLYHLCPSKMTFQFDTAFMFVIAGLIVVLLNNGIKLEECPSKGEAKGPVRVEAANFFLCFVVPLYVFNYFGSLYHSEAGLITAVKVLFFLLLPVWCLVIAIWAGYKIFPNKCFSKKKRDQEGGAGANEGAGGGDERNGTQEASTERDTKGEKWSNSDKIKFVFYGLGLGLPIAFLILWVIDYFPQAFLITCICECAFVILWRLIKKTCLNSSGNGSKKCCDKLGCRCVFQVIYVVVTLAVLILAVIFFCYLPTTNKVEAPEQSRNLNHECVNGLRFFDYHDIWHILSSFALLMGAHLLMYISYEPPKSGQGGQQEGTGGNPPEGAQGSQGTGDTYTQTEEDTTCDEIYHDARSYVSNVV